MRCLSAKRLRLFLMMGGVVGCGYMILGHDALLVNRLCNAFFLAGLVPADIGGFRLAKRLGAFDLIIYTHRKLWKYGKKQDKWEQEITGAAPEAVQEPGSYYEYLSAEKPAQSYREPLAVGGGYLLVSGLFMLQALSQQV